MVWQQGQRESRCEILANPWPGYVKVRRNVSALFFAHRITQECSFAGQYLMLLQVVLDRMKSMQLTASVITDTQQIQVFIHSSIHYTLSNPQIRCVAADILWQPKFRYGACALHAKPSFSDVIAGNSSILFLKCSAPS